MESSSPRKKKQKFKCKRCLLEVKYVSKKKGLCRRCLQYQHKEYDPEDKVLYYFKSTGSPNITHIANLVGVSRRTVYKILARNGIRK